MFFSGLIASLCTYLITKVYSPWQFLILFGIAGGFASAGAGEFAVGSVIPKWFIKKRGKALAFGTMGGVLVGSDSAIYTTLITENAKPEELASSLAVHTVFAFGTAAISPLVFRIILDIFGLELIKKIFLPFIYIKRQALELLKKKNKII